MTEINYNQYSLSTLETILYILLYIIISSVYALLFYNSWLPVIFSLPFIKLFFKYIKNLLIRKRKEQLLLEFKEWLFSINSSLTSGYALENAIAESLNELETLFGKKSFMYKEVYLMNQKLKLNIPLDNILNDFANAPFSLSLR